MPTHPTRHLLFAASCGVLFATAAAATDLRLAGDANPWRIASDTTSRGVRTVELLRPGRNFGNSPEILVITRQPGDDASEAASEYLDRKLADCDEGHYEFLRSGWEDTSYRWESRSCSAPDTDLDEVGRVFVADGDVVHLALFVRDYRRAGFWESWISGRYGSYSSWSSGIFSTGRGRLAEAPIETSDGSECADDDIDCLVAAQRRNLAAMDQLARGGDDDGGYRPSSGRRGPTDVETSDGSECADDDVDCLVAAQQRNLAAMDRLGRGGSTGKNGKSAGGGRGTSTSSCCTVRALRGLHLQRSNPFNTRSERVSTFTSTDTYIYGVVDLAGEQGGSVVTFRWVKLNGGGEKVVVTRDITIEPGATFVYGSLYYSGLTPTGDFRLDVSFDGEYAGSIEFTVVAGSSFG
jgi:hypothetical protein